MTSPLMSPISLQLPPLTSSEMGPRRTPMESPDSCLRLAPDFVHANDLGRRTSFGPQLHSPASEPGLVMALIGSLLSILVAIIMPTLCFVKIKGNKATARQVALCLTIIIVGITGAAFGTYSSVSAIAGSY